MQSSKKIFLIAGEESGDNLGSKLIKAIKEKNRDIEFTGIGGMKMAYEGMKLVFHLDEINFFGFLEIIPHIPKLIKRVNQTVEKIIAEKPDVLVTIDSPGFNFRVAKKIKEAGYKGKMIHYVAPSVWAYKPERAKKIAKLFDYLICILPWEPKYFIAENLQCSFIGHPVFEDFNFLDEAQKSALKKDYNYDENDRLIAIFPGSRKSELNRLLPIFTAAARKIFHENSNTKFILMPTENLRDKVTAYTNELPNCLVISNTNEKRKLLQICAAAIVKSGTVALEVSALKCPNIICYKVNEISHFIIRRMLKINFANLINISAGKEIIRELIQEDCTADNISNEILKLINSEVTAKGQMEEAEYELKEMGLGAEISPSHKAAEIVLKSIN